MTRILMPVAMAFVMLLGACGKKVEPVSAAAGIEGQWLVVSNKTAAGVLIPVNESASTIYEFRADKTYSFKSVAANAVATEGTYKLEGTSLVLTVNGSDSSLELVSVDASTLDIKFLSGLFSGLDQIMSRKTAEEITAISAKY